MRRDGQTVELNATFIVSMRISHTPGDPDYDPAAEVVTVAARSTS
jgi:hypothetical protein